MRPCYWPPVTSLPMPPPPPPIRFKALVSYSGLRLKLTVLLLDVLGAGVCLAQLCALQVVGSCCAEPLQDLRQKVELVKGSHYRQAATVTARFCMVIYCMWWTLCDIQKNSVNVDFISFWNNAKPFCHPPPSLLFCCANCENGTDSVKKAVSNSKVHFNSIICTPFILVCSHPKPILHSTAEDKDIPAKTCSSSAEHLLWTLQIFFSSSGST